MFCAEPGPCLSFGRYGDVDPDKRNIKRSEKNRAQGRKDPNYCGMVSVEYVSFSKAIMTFFQLPQRALAKIKAFFSPFYTVFDI